MTIALIIVFIIAGTFFFLWQEEHEKLVKAEKQIKDLQRQIKAGFATIEKSESKQEYIIKRPDSKPVKPLLDHTKLIELQKQTRESQNMLAEIFVHEEESPTVPIITSENGPMLKILMMLFEKDVWTRAEIAEMAGPDVMIGSLLEQINDYSCSKIDDIVVEEDGDKIYVTTEYKTQLI